MKAVVFALLLFFGLSACTKEASKEAAEAELKVLMDEIDLQVASTPCTDAGQWRFTPIGAKPCGGPAGYKAYSSQMDTTAFLNKVKRYTEKNLAYNKEWNLFSDCALTPKPKGVQCVEGKAALLY